MNDNKKETIGNDLENFIKEKKNGEVLYLGDDTERFILGESGANPIICFGINPSTANALTLASWGNAIEKRKYLKDCLKKILAIAPDRKWVCRGKLTVKGNPRHQLYVPNNTKLQDLYFSLEGKVLCSKD